MRLPRIKVWDGASGRVDRSMTGHNGNVRAIAAETNKCRVFSGGDDGTCRLWDVERGACLAQTEPRDDAVTCVAICDDNALAFGPEIFRKFGSLQGFAH